MFKLLLSIFICFSIVYLFIKQHKKKTTDKNTSIKEATSENLPITDGNRKNQLIFTYYEGEGEVTTYKIIPYHKTENFLEGFCLNTKKDKLFKIDNIAYFLDESRAIFDSLKADSSILQKEYLALEKERKQKSKASHKYSIKRSDKGHKKWDEDNRVEIFIRYKNAAGETKDRVVRLINHDDSYKEKGFKGYCKMANGLRTFLPSRIQTYYKDSRERLERFFKDPHFNRDQLTLSFIGFGEMEMEGYKYLGEQYNFRALKSITVNTDIVVTNRKLSELTNTQQKRIEENSYPIISSKGLAHLLETGEISEEI